MEYYIPTILAGVVLSVLCLWLLPKEETRRTTHFRRCYHTRIVPLGSGKARSLRSSYYIIGRRLRRCDIRLNDGSVSKVHAILWHDGYSFRIAPCRDMELLELGQNDKELPQVYVNGERIPDEGVALDWGDVIRLGDCRLLLENICD